MITRHSHSFGQTWTDLVAPANGVNPIGPDTAATLDAALGTVVFANGANASAFVSFQLPHSYAEGTDIEPHVHWMHATSSTEDVRWRMKSVWFNVGSTMPAFSAYSTAGEIVTNLSCGLAQTQHIHAWMLSGAGKRISSVLLFGIQRFDGAGGGDAYGGDAHLLSVDVHYRQAQPGSVQEYSLP